MADFGVKIVSEKVFFPDRIPGKQKTYVYFLIQMTGIRKKLCEKTKKGLKKNRLLCMIDISHG